MQIKKGNPLAVEYKRANYRGWVLVVLFSLMFGVISFVQFHQQQSQNRQRLLKSVAMDLEHQLAPYLSLLQLLQQHARSQLTQEVTGSVLANDYQVPLKAQAQLLPAESMFLAEMVTTMKSALLHQPAIRALGYYSVQGVWVSTQSASMVPQQHGTRLSQALVSKTTSDNNMFSWSLRDPSTLVFAIPVRQQTLLGYWVLEIELPKLLQALNPIEYQATIVLMSDTAEPILAVQDSQLISDGYDGLHQSDIHQTLTDLPYVLHVQPNSEQLIQREFLFFVGQTSLFFLFIAALHLYLRWRFKRKVLGPFARLNTHWNRLERGDPVGVRHVPAEWKPWFDQADRVSGRVKDRAE